MSKSVLICPVCRNPLIQYQKYYACLNKHTFDKSKQGYVNLLLANQKRTLQPGDNKEMVNSRLQFLKLGYYLPIAHALNEAIMKSIPAQKGMHQIADIGCGVGYYLTLLKNHLASTFFNLTFWGIDISKDAIHCANAQDKSITWLIGSAKNLPFESQSLDSIVSVFSPFYSQEIQRVLSPNGQLFIITPAHNHLIELREILFDEVKDIDTDKLIQKTKDNFTLLDAIPIRSSIQLQSQDEITHLLKMTPFFWSTTAEKKEKLHSLSMLTTLIDVTLHVFKHRSKRTAANAAGTVTFTI